VTTFRIVFGRCDWSLMFILARGGATYARLRFRAGPGGWLWLPVRIDWGQPFAGTDERAWQTEYDLCVQPFDVRHFGPTLDDTLDIRQERWEAELA
jgi:hypothetical protein